MLGKAAGGEEFEEEENLEGGERGENKKREDSDTWTYWEKEQVPEKRGMGRMGVKQRREGTEREEGRADELWAWRLQAQRQGRKMWTDGRMQ